MSILKEVGFFHWLSSVSGALSGMFPGASYSRATIPACTDPVRWLRWGPNIWAGQTTETLQGTVLWKYFCDPRGKCLSLSDVRLVPDMNHNLVYKCSRRMLQSASVVLLKAFVRTNYKDLQNHKWKKPEGLLCWKDIVDENPRSEEKWKVKVSMKSGFGCSSLQAPLPSGRSGPQFVEGKAKYLPGMGENQMQPSEAFQMHYQNNASERSSWVGVLYLSVPLSTGLSKALVRSLQPWAFSICLSQYCCS